MEFNMIEEAHPLASKGDVCFVNGKLISVADDSVLKVYKIKNGTLIQQSHLELSSSEHESLAVCSNQMDKLMIGGKNKTVNMYSLNEDMNITMDTFQNPVLALKL
jgi:hypothetical protein